MKILRLLKGAGIRSSYGTMGASASTLIDDEGIKIIVDIGHFGNRDALNSSLKANGLNFKDIDKVVLTHLNWDHCLNIDLFENSEILLNENEFKEGTLSGIADNFSIKFKEFLSTFKIKFVDEGYYVSPHSYILDTPGHTIGHISLVLKDNAKTIIIAGDAIPNLRSYDRGVPDLIFYNLDYAIKSIEKVKNLNPDIIYPGHDPPFNKKGYLEEDPIDIILRNRDESNTVVEINKKIAEKPLVIKNE
ncbi:MAG: MBL fold metallo-hydrolase [Thermoplasmata archaeon]